MREIGRFCFSATLYKQPLKLPKENLLLHVQLDSNLALFQKKTSEIDSRLMQAQSNYKNFDSTVQLPYPFKNMWPRSSNPVLLWISHLLDKMEILF